MFLQESFKSSMPEGFFHTREVFYGIASTGPHGSCDNSGYHQSDGTVTNDWMAEEGGGGVTTEMGSQSVTHFMQLKRYVGTT